MAIKSTGPSIKVRIEKGKAEKTDFSFTKPFRIGRDESCELRIDDPEVSRFHAEIWFLRDKWWILDLESANGTFVDGKKVERSPLTSNTRIQLGENGPIFSVQTEEVPKAEHTQIDRTVTRYIQRYFTDSDGTDAGEHTLMLRRAFEKVQKKQKRKFGLIIAVVACLFLLAGTYAVFKHREARKQKLLAENIFYAMKSLELEFAGFLKTARLRKDAYTVARMAKYKAKREEMLQSYDQFIETLEVYGKKISPEERIILHLARTFGECEINMPPGFVAEVTNYIEKWKASDRLEKTILRAKSKGYITKITDTMLAHDLPPQFFYLALQESNLDVNACGPKTRYGIAKGMWQFIPSTAAYYGLRAGPLVHLRRPDPRDERHHFGKSTQAAARYIRDIYDTEAQASGLLVIASYNWGERRIIELIRKMPENPRERNFWRLLKNHKKEIPTETYDYVFRIISAAVIGENPRLFGLDFDNPLEHVER